MEKFVTPFRIAPYCDLCRFHKKETPIRGSRKFILLDKGPCWAQCCRRDVRGFFLARPVFPSQALFSYRRCKANVPLPREGNSTCSLLPAFHRRIADGAEGRYSRNTLRRREHSNKRDGSCEGCFVIGTSTVGHRLCANNVCAVAENQCPQNLAGLYRSVDRLLQASGTPLFSPLLNPLSRHHCFLV